MQTGSPPEMQRLSMGTILHPLSAVSGTVHPAQLAWEIGGRMLGAARVLAPPVCDIHHACTQITPVATLPFDWRVSCCRLRSERPQTRLQAPSRRAQSLRSMRSRQPTPATGLGPKPKNQNPAPDQPSTAPTSLRATQKMPRATLGKLKRGDLWQLRPRHPFLLHRLTMPAAPGAGSAASQTGCGGPAPWRPCCLPNGPWQKDGLGQRTGSEGLDCPGGLPSGMTADRQTHAPSFLWVRQKTRLVSVG